MESVGTLEVSGLGFMADFVTDTQDELNVLHCSPLLIRYSVLRDVMVVGKSKEVVDSLLNWLFSAHETQWNVNHTRRISRSLLSM